MLVRYGRAFVVALLNLVLLAVDGVTAQLGTSVSFRETSRFTAAEAHQAVAVGESSIYAISNKTICRYDKDETQPITRWTAPEDSQIVHLNSGVVVEGRLICANSNWPSTPLRNTIEIFDASSLKHIDQRVFSESKGAINWIERHQGTWWVVFAFYGDSVRQTRLVRFDDNWEPTGRWTFPKSVTDRFLPHSNSGGGFGPNGRLYVTGHDHPELYILSIPDKDGELKHETTTDAPIAGQGIAWDRSDIGTLYGIVRRTHEVVSMRLTHPMEYTQLKRPVEWIRDANNPVLPPLKGRFDSNRCMNPWIIQVDQSYKLFYSGGDKEGRQRIGVATASISDISTWSRGEPLFKTGLAGSFDARWCVLPHVVQINDRQWHLYYTGNAGRGSGLSAFPGIGLATSDDGITWTRSDRPPVIAPSGESGTPDAIGIAGGSVIGVPNSAGIIQWRFYYTGCPSIGQKHALNQQKTICLAVSDDGIEWTKRGAVMLRDPNRDYENIGVAGPVVLRDDDGLYRMWYSAIGSRWGFYSICYAESNDGLLWRRGQMPEENLQLTPMGSGWEQQMVEYPSVIRETNRLRLFYCGNGYGRTGIGTAVSRE